MALPITNNNTDSQVLTTLGCGLIRSRDTRLCQLPKSDVPPCPTYPDSGRVISRC